MFWEKILSGPKTNSLFIYQDKNKHENQNQSFRLLLYDLKQTCDEWTKRMNQM